MRRDDNPRTRLIERLLSEPRRLIVTILIGNEFVNVAASVISAAIVTRFLGADSKLVNLLIMIPILLLVGEITARSHFRLPVYHERVDRVVGVLDTLELLGVPAEECIQPYVKPVSYVPPGKSIQELLLHMRKTGQQMTFVVDEFGGAEGIVSIEDILEEVVEDIQDEYDAQEPVTQ
jgi:CBS domain containing-hemolysin-like protein